MVKQCSLDVQTRDDTFGVQEVDGSCQMKSSSHSSVSYTVMNQLVKGPLSLAWAVPEIDLIAMALEKEQTKCKADN